MTRSFNTLIVPTEQALFTKWLSKYTSSASQAEFDFARIMQQWLVFGRVTFTLAILLYIQMASYFDELGIQTNHSKKKKTYDVDLDEFMNPATGTVPATSGTLENRNQVEQLLQTARFFGQFRQQMQTGGDADQERFLDDLVTQLLEESQSEAKGPPPASRRFIDTLPHLNKETLDREESCIICKDNLKSSENTATGLPCGHLFDLECIVPWLQLHHTCPMCRHKFETEEQVKEEEEEEQRSWMYG